MSEHHFRAPRSSWAQVLSIHIFKKNYFQVLSFDANQDLLQLWLKSMVFNVVLKPNKRFPKNKLTNQNSKCSIKLKEARDIPVAWFHFKSVEKRVRLYFNQSERNKRKPKKTKKNLQWTINKNINKNKSVSHFVLAWCPFISF